MSPRRKKRKPLFRLIGLLVFLSIISVATLIFTHTKKSAVATSIQGEDTYTQLSLSASVTPVQFLGENSQGLSEAVSQALAGSSGSYGIVIKNLKTGESYQQNAGKVYDSASLYKLWVMAAVFGKIQKKKLHESDVLHKDIQYLGKEYNVPLDPSGLMAGTLTLSVQDALYKMITISDNDAALLLTDNVRLQSIADFLGDSHLTESHLGVHGEDPTTTAQDIALFFQELYNGQLANETYTSEMLDLLKSQNLNEKIPQYLPDGTVVAHKTGELDNFSHDAGIIYSPQGDFILVVLSESDDPLLANNRISAIAQAVYTYFNPD